MLQIRNKGRRRHHFQRLLIIKHFHSLSKNISCGIVPLRLQPSDTIHINRVADLKQNTSITNGFECKKLSQGQTWFIVSYIFFESGAFRISEI